MPGSHGMTHYELAYMCLKHTHTHIYTHSHMHTHTLPHVCAHTHTNTHTHSHMHGHAHTHTHTDILVAIIFHATMHRCIDTSDKLTHFQFNTITEIL